jgi:type IV pilus assembly protein PilM
VVIGLDIGSSAVRAAELERHRGGRPRLIRYGEVTLPTGAVIDGDVVEPEVVAEALRQLWGMTGMKGHSVAVGLASQRVTVRQIDLPDLPDDELADAVRMQGQDHLPMPVDEALIDFVVVSRYPVDGGRRNIRVLLVAAEREMVERLLGAVTAAKLRPVVVDLDAFALLRSLATTTTTTTTAAAEGEGEGEHAEPNDPIVPPTEVVVDIGAMLTKFAVHRGGDPLFVRMTRFGGAGSTQELQQVLELSWEQAEKAKLDASAAMAGGAQLDADDERVRVLRHGVQKAITELRHSLDFFRSQHDDIEVQRVLLSGGASLAPDLADQLETALDLPVAQGDPLRSVDASHRRGAPNGAGDETPFLAVPVGLALGLLR